VAEGSCAQDAFLFSEARRLFNSNQMLLSATHFSALRASNCDPTITSRSWFGYALATHRLDEDSEALSAIDEGLRQRTLATEDQAALRMLQTWIRQEPHSDLTPEQELRWKLWSERLNRPRYLDTLNKTSFTPVGKTAFSELDLKLITTPQKSIWLSALSSAVLPGAGQAYVGNWQAAGLSFVINAVFLSATIEFARKDMPAAAIASGGVFSITYIGNIVGAGQSANDWNRLNRAPSEENLKRVLLPELTF
jgi:hypothetical protein